MESRRPVLLTVICVMGFIACSLGMILVYTPEVLRLGKVYALFRSLSFSALAVCFAGFWRMRRWAVWAFAACLAVNQMVCLYFGNWDKNTLLPLVALAITAFYYRRMK